MSHVEPIKKNKETLIDASKEVGLEINVDTTKYKTIILPLVLYGCETWSLTLREEHRLRVLVLRRIFGQKKKDEVTGE
jgi:hypothetical protein